jgi:hypothetical protein
MSTPQRTRRISILIWIERHSKTLNEAQIARLPQSYLSQKLVMDVLDLEATWQLTDQM